MSLWDKYLAPGDLRRQRAQQQQQQQLHPPPATKHDDNQPQVLLVKPPPPRLSPSERTRRQTALLYGGLAFTTLSLFITRRALQRKNAQVQAQALARALNPPSSPAAAAADAAKVDGSLEAVQALGYATLNVFSFAMLAVGGAMTYFDFADLEDLREGVRGQAGYSTGGGGAVGDEESEREIEEWVAEHLARRDGRGRDAVVGEVEVELRRKVEERRSG